MKLLLDHALNWKESYHSSYTRIVHIGTDGLLPEFIPLLTAHELAHHALNHVGSFNWIERCVIEFQAWYFVFARYPRTPDNIAFARRCFETYAKCDDKSYWLEKFDHYIPIQYDCEVY